MYFYYTLVRFYHGSTGVMYDHWDFQAIRVSETHTHGRVDKSTRLKLRYFCLTVLVRVLVGSDRCVFKQALNHYCCILRMGRKAVGPLLLQPPDET